MQIFVRLFNGKILKIDYEPFYTVKEIKDIIYKNVIDEGQYERKESSQILKYIVDNTLTRNNPLPQDEQRLIFVGKQLENNRILESYNLQRESSIHLCRRLRGDVYLQLNLLMKKILITLLSVLVPLHQNGEK